jgi:hypothetical protein
MVAAQRSLRNLLKKKYPDGLLLLFFYFFL